MKMKKAAERRASAAISAAATTITTLIIRERVIKDSKMLAVSSSSCLSETTMRVQSLKYYSKDSESSEQRGTSKWEWMDERQLTLRLQQT